MHELDLDALCGERTQVKFGGVEYILRHQDELTLPEVERLKELTSQKTPESTQHAVEMMFAGDAPVLSIRMLSVVIDRFFAAPDLVTEENSD